MTTTAAAPGTELEEPGTGAGETTSSRVRDIARRDPQRPAVVVDSTVLTYAELDEAGDALAARLLAELKEPGERVPFQCAGTIPMVVAALGIVRAGMVSVPVDPTAPTERLAFILEDVSARVLLSDLPVHGELDVTVAHPLEFRAEIPAGGVDRELGEMASIVFTSGSTGVPKGIMVPREHRIDLRYKITLIEGMPEGVRFGALAAGTVGFAEGLVHSVLHVGGSLYAYEIRRLGVAPLAQWLLETKVIGFATVPTIMRYVLPTLPEDLLFPDIDIIVLTGETTTWEDVREIRKHLTPAATVFNMFGLTETSGIAALAIDGETPMGTGPLPAGHPVDRMVITIVDDEGEPVATGERGEIVVEGDGCTLGYWARPELTAKVFTRLADGTRRVRTGDGGRWRPDGLLEHLGRLDHVVKISGNRVELGEVETTLRALDGVAAAAAAPYNDAAGNTRLTAFVVALPNARLDPWVLRAALARRLPGPMVPDHVEVVEELPQLANGKVDRKRLPERVVTANTASGAPDESHAALGALVAEVLELESVGPDDDFFELGGDSMRAARLFALIEQRLGLNRPVTMLLEARTVRALSAALATDAGALGVLVPIQTSGALPPLFVVHDGMGDIFFASRLPQALGEDQPVYGIQPAALLGEPQPETSIEQLAARYLKDVRQLRPTGPYLFYGYSLGGIIAFEMARQLQELGERVELLALGDSPAPRLPTKRRALSRLAQLRRLAPADAFRLTGALGVNQFKHLALAASNTVRGRRKLARELMAAAAAAPAPTSPEKRGEFIMVHYGMMAVSYQPQCHFDGSVLLVRSSDLSQRPYLSWDHVVTGSVRIVDVNAAHDEMGKEPAIGAIGAALRQAIEQGAGPTAP